jgi:hypothetical protein
MPKTIKSFNVEKETYDALVKVFKNHKTSTSLSYFVDQCLVKLLDNLSEAAEVLKKTEYFPDIMKFVIEKYCNEVIITTPGLRPIPYGVNCLNLGPDPESSVLGGIIVKEEEVETNENDEWLPQGEGPEDMEGLYWIEEYEAQKQNLPRVFARLLKTGKYELSRDRKLLIEKKTGKKFINLGETHVVEVLPNAKVIGPNDEK